LPFTKIKKYNHPFSATHGNGQFNHVRRMRRNLNIND
jgi:hypothetical protein